MDGWLWGWVGWGRGGWVDIWEDGWLYHCMSRWMGGRMSGLKHGSLARQMDGRKGVWLYG